MSRTFMFALGLLIVASCTTGAGEQDTDGGGADPGTGAQLSLSWTDNSDNEAGFVIERRLEAGGDYAELARTDADVAAYADGAVEVGTGYCYRVAAFNMAGQSAFTDEACAAAHAGASTRLSVEAPAQSETVIRTVR